MKTLIAGSRSFQNLNSYIIDSFIGHFNKVSEIVSGTAKGIDRLGEIWAEEYNIPIKKFPANWNKYGKEAGFIRNKEMVDYCDQALIIWDGESRGTKHDIDLLNESNKPYLLVRLKVEQFNYNV